MEALEQDVAETVDELLVNFPVAADPAILLGSTICQNQRDAMDYQWVSSIEPYLKLYFVSGNTAANGAITSAIAFIFPKSNWIAKSIPPTTRRARRGSILPIEEIRKSLCIKTVK